MCFHVASFFCFSAKKLLKYYYALGRWAKILPRDALRFRTFIGL